MKSSMTENQEIYGPPIELFVLARALDEADISIEKCLSIMQNTKADFQKPQQDAFVKIFDVIAGVRNYLYVTNDSLNTRPLSRLLDEWHDTFQGAKPKFTNIKSNNLKKGGSPILTEKNHTRALLVAAVKIKIKQGAGVSQAEKQVAKETGVKPSTLREWRSDFNRKDGPPKAVRALVNGFEKAENLNQQYANLISQFNLRKKV